jgi:predicted Zn-dependent protease
MKKRHDLKQKLLQLQKLRADKQYDAALDAVQELRAAWPGNPRLHVIWAELVQLQDNPKDTLVDVRKALESAVKLDESSPAAAIELGHFLDNVEDDPRAASKVFAEAAQVARDLLIDALTGHAKALLQLGKKKAATRCLIESLRLSSGSSNGPSSSADNGPRLAMRGTHGPTLDFQLQGPFAEEIESLLQDVLASKSA